MLTAYRYTATTLLGAKGCCRGQTTGILFRAPGILPTISRRMPRMRASISRQQYRLVLLSLRSNFDGEIAESFSKSEHHEVSRSEPSVSRLLVLLFVRAFRWVDEPPGLRSTHVSWWLPSPSRAQVGRAYIVYPTAPSKPSRHPASRNDPRVSAGWMEVLLHPFYSYTECISATILTASKSYSILVTVAT